MTFLRRIVMRAARELLENREARVKASQILEKDVKPRAKRVWRELHPRMENAKVGLKRIAEEIREEYRKGREGE